MQRGLSPRLDGTHLETLLDSAKVKPAANQILLHPYVWERQAPLVAFCQKHGIVVEAYSVLMCVNYLSSRHSVSRVHEVLWSAR